MPGLDELRAVRALTAAHYAKPQPQFKRPKRAKDFVPILATGAIGDLTISMRVASVLAIRTQLPVEVWSDHSDVGRFLRRAQGRKESSYWDRVTFHSEPFPGFDWYIRLNSIASFEISSNFRGFPAEVNPTYQDWSGIARQESWARLIRYHPGLDNELARAAIRRGWNRESLPFRMLGLQPPLASPMIRTELETPVQPYDWEPFITVHDGFESRLTALRATKTWNIRYWETLVQEIRKVFPDHYIIQLGGPNSRSIPGVHVNLVGKTAIDESLRILSRSSAHIDGDSGLVHCARLFGIRSVVMFGPTPSKFFGYPENLNLEPDTCGGCWWLTDDWLGRCAVGNPSPACMDSIHPWRVLEALVELMYPNRIRSSLGVVE